MTRRHPLGHVPWVAIVLCCTGCSPNTETDDERSSGGSVVDADGSSASGGLTGSEPAPTGAGVAGGEHTDASEPARVGPAAGDVAPEEVGSSPSEPAAGSRTSVGGAPAMMGAADTPSESEPEVPPTAGTSGAESGQGGFPVDDGVGLPAQAGAAGQEGQGGGAAELGGAGGHGGAGEAELPSYAPEGYDLAYEESFGEADSFEQLLIANEQDWFYDPAGFVEFTAASYEPPYRSPFSVALIRGVSASSFVMEVEMLQTSVGEGHRDMVILWNVVSPSEFYYAHISEQHDDVAHHIHIVNYADRTPITETFTQGFDWGIDVWRTLRVVRDAVSGTMEVYDVDSDEQILSATDTTFSTGFFGVGSFDNTGRVRNVRIWSPDATKVAIPFSF